MKYTALFLVLCSFLYGGCHKDQTSRSSGMLTEARPAPEGMPVGTAITRVIGQAGGVLQTDDGKFTVNIPAGALDNNATFSLTPVQNTAPNAVGTGYKLQPEDIHFNRPVTFQLHYTEDDLDGGSADVLGLAYQGSSHIWTVQAGICVDTASKTVTVTSTSVGVWSAFKAIDLFVDRRSIDYDEQAILQVRAVREVKSAHGEVELDTGLTKKEVSKWTLQRDGSVSSNGDSTIYRAPSFAPHPNPVTVSAQVNLSSGSMLSRTTISRKIFVCHTCLEVEMNGNTSGYPYPAKDVVETTNHNRSKPNVRGPRFKKTH